MTSALQLVGAALLAILGVWMIVRSIRAFRKAWRRE